MRASVWTFALVLGGCGPAGAVIGDADDSVVEDDTVEPGDTGNVDDTDAPDTDTDSPPGAATWTGWREFRLPEVQGQPNGCVERVEEEGPEVTLDPTYAGAVAACPSCEQVFLLTASADRVCDVVDIASPVLRGVDRRPDGSATLMRLDYDPWRQEYRSDLLADEVSVEGTRLEFRYEGQINNRDRFEVVGEAVIE